MFNNFRAYVLPQDHLRAATATPLAEVLESYASEPPRDYQMETLGFVQPGGQHDWAEKLQPLGMLRVPGPPVHFELRLISRNIPATAVRREVALRVSEIQQKENRRVGGRERQEIKQDVLDDMMPQAFLVEKTIRALAIGTFLVIDQTSESVCDAVLSLFRDVLGKLDARPLMTAKVPHQSMTQWVLDQSTGHDDLSIGNSFKVKGIFEKGLTLSGSKLDLSEEDPEFVSQIVNGRDAEALGLFHHGKESTGVVSFTLTDKLVFKGVRWPEEYTHAADEQLGQQDDEAAHRQVNLSLIAHGIASLISSVTDALGGLNTSLNTQADDEEDLL